MIVASTIQEVALQTVRLEAESVGNLVEFINEDFVRAVETIHASKGRLVVSGIGKSAIIAQKIVATLNSTGTPALFLHAADAIHGDLGMVQAQDVVMVISKSGESAEIKVLVPLIKNFGNKLIGMVGNVLSSLAVQSDIVLNTTVSQEACPNNLAPTSSTTAQMVMGDALAVALMNVNGFTGADFAKFHPGGALGKKLYLRVHDLYANNPKPEVGLDASLHDVIVMITTCRLGATAVVDAAGKLLGIITDGDLRRMLAKDIDLNHVQAKDIYSQSPKTIGPDALAIEALDIMRQNDITQLVVEQDGVYHGIIHLHELIKEGLI